MCGLCGVLGQVGHWTDSEDSLSQRSVSATRRRERAYQLRIINRVLNRSGLRVNDWQSSAFIVSSNTGASEIVDHISMLWPIAEKMSGTIFDPLDPELLTMLSEQ